MTRSSERVAVPSCVAAVSDRSQSSESIVTEEDAETRRGGDAESLPRRATRDSQTHLCANVLGYEAPPNSENWALEIGRGYNPRPISVPASPRLRVPVSLHEHINPLRGYIQASLVNCFLYSPQKGFRLLSVDVTQLNLEMRNEPKTETSLDYPAATVVD